MNIYDINVKNLEGNKVSLSKYKGKVLLIVNTATKCGFTPQYNGLEALYEKYHDDGFEILDFPCNQFNDRLLAVLKKSILSVQLISISSLTSLRKLM